MREYATVSPRFWTGETGKFLRRHPNAQRLAFYLMTCPNSTMLGLFYVPLPTIVHETGMTLEQVREGFERGLEGGFARYDEVSETVYIPEMARFQIADELKPKDNRSIAVEKALAAFVKSHKSPYVKDFVEKYAARFHLQNVEGYRRGPGGVSDPCRSQDQDQVQDQVQDQERKTSDSSEPGNPASEPEESSASKALIARSEDPSPDDPVVLTFPVVGNKSKPTWNLTASKLAEYQDSYPNLDVLAEFRRARQWCIDKPFKRKRAKGMPAFLGNWLGSATDRGRGSDFRPPTQTRGQVKDQYAANVLFNGIGGSPDVEAANF